MSVERVPLAQSINKRSANDNKDNTIINCLFESHPTGKRLVKRPGLLPQITVSSGGLSQGIFPWNSRLVTILNNEVWGMTLSSGTQFGTLPGTVPKRNLSFTQTALDAHLVINDQANFYYITKASVDAGTPTVVAPSGTVVSATVDNIGTNGYYSTAPAVTFSATSPDVAATGHAVLYNNRVASIVIDTPGTYATAVPTVTVAAPPAGTSATITGAIGHYAYWLGAPAGLPFTSVGEYTISGGSGYNSPPTITFSYGVTAIGNLTNGVVTSLTFTNYGSNPYGYPVPLTANVPAPVGTTATATAVMGSGGITGPFAYGIEYLDGYLFIMKTDGSIYQTQNLNDPTVWIASVIRAESEPDAGQALVKHLNYLLAFGEWSTDVFYNAGNPTGSILNVNKSSKLEIGCVSGPTVAKLEQSIIWVGQSITQGRGVYMMDGLSPVKVSTRTVDKYLNSLVPWGECFSYCVKFGGHTLYVLTLTDQDTTLVYDIDEKEWTFFSSQTLGTEHYFNQTHYAGDTEYFGQPFMLHATDGTISVFDSEYYLDNTDAIYCTVRTPITDSGTTKRKFYRKVEVVGDKVVGIGYISHSDDDYQTTSTPRSVELIRERPILFQCGQARRRSWKFFYSDSTPLRVEALEVDYDIGEIQA